MNSTLIDYLTLLSERGSEVKLAITSHVNLYSLLFFSLLPSRQCTHSKTHPAPRKGKIYRRDETHNTTYPPARSQVI